MNLSTPTEEIQRIGSVYAKRLKKLGIEKVRDLLFHFPSRYEDYSKITSIANVNPDDFVTIQGKIVHISERNSFKRNLKIIEAVIEDETDTIKAVWFNQSYVKNRLDTNSPVLLAGKVTHGKDGIYLSNPASEVVRLDSVPIHTGRIVPIYPETRGVTSRWLRYIIYKLLPLAENIEDPMPEEILKAHDLLPLKDALYTIHFPANMEIAQKAKRRFEFEQLFYVQLSALKTKLDLQKENSPKIKTEVELTKKFVKSLPFTLTDSQKKASWQILKDMERKVPMNRMLEGDVGSGKTIVAALAALNVAKAGFQTALMAPTEILAEQHFKSLSELFKNQDIQIALFTRSHQKTTIHEKKLTKETIKKEIATGAVDLIIGTHTLAQENVKFKNLGLVVIDEQHRFGVSYRAALAKKTGQSSSAKASARHGKSSPIPHLLSMTATPIPRSLALTIYGDLDISLLKEMPEGRKEIITKIVPPSKRNEAYKLIQKELDVGRQAFCIFPLIEVSEKLEAKAAKEEYEKLSSGPFKNYNVGLLHGKIKAKEKEEIMRDMKEGKIDLLVATSVVEVGIDIPNATIMMVDGAERFGLAQLHQFRGRVGRDKHQSYCFLLTESNTDSTAKRLQALTKAKNGFELAEYDLKFRGAGDLYGVRQSGMPDIAMASLSNMELIEETRDSANKILEKDGDLKKWTVLKEIVEEMQKTMHFE
ncbi:MAG: ATP-dependent DNA helicase RecG [Candidatus Spechtbacterales bacterium]